MVTVTEQAATNKTPNVDLREEMNLAIVGHVDHGKSTLIGRLLSDTNTLPEGKLEQVKHYCARNAKPFEYAFLLDALKVEQAQGITVDTARCFFQTDKRRYIILDTPGHLEFLKNMVTGASRAEAAILIIDASEGIKENSYRHGYLLSMLGIRQIAVVVNKLDLIDYDESIFRDICCQYATFLESIHITPTQFIPVSARQGDNIAKRSRHMPWYTGPVVVDCIDTLQKEPARAQQAFRLPVQDVYKFTNDGDTRRIVAGTVTEGTVRVGDQVVFLPCGKMSHVKTIEQFNAEPATVACAGEAVGFTLTDELYIRPGDMMYRVDQSPPKVARAFRANVFWLGKSPLTTGKTYKLKLCAVKIPAQVESICSALDAVSLDISGKKAVDCIAQNQVGECIIRLSQPITFDLTFDIKSTSRFVLVDGYEIAGGGIITTVEDLQAEAQVDRPFVPHLSALPIANGTQEAKMAAPLMVTLLYNHKADKDQALSQLHQALSTSGRSFYTLSLHQRLDYPSEWVEEVLYHLLHAGRNVVLSYTSEQQGLVDCLKTDRFMINYQPCHIEYDGESIYQLTCDGRQFGNQAELVNFLLGKL